MNVGEVWGFPSEFGGYDLIVVIDVGRFEDVLVFGKRTDVRTFDVAFDVRILWLETNNIGHLQSDGYLITQFCRIDDTLGA